MGADEENRCRGQMLPARGRYKKTNVTWRSRCVKLKEEHDVADVLIDKCG